MGYAVQKSVLDTTIDMLKPLNDVQLLAIQSVVKAFSAETEDDGFFKPLSEEELIERIERGLDDAKNGRYEDSDIVVERLRMEFGL